MLLLINYPNSHFTIHDDHTCSEILKQKKPDSRIMRISPVNLETQLHKLKGRKIRFAAEETLSSLWIELHVGSKEREEALVQQIQSILGVRYRRLAKAPIQHHC